MRLSLREFLLLRIVACSMARGNGTDEASSIGKEIPNYQPATPAAGPLPLGNLVSVQLGEATCAVVEHVTFDGNDIDTVPSESSDECCAACRANSACVAYTHFEGRCFLKSTSANRHSCDGCRSGTLYDHGRCSVEAEPLSYEGNDLINVSSAEPDGCCAHCAKYPLCLAYTHWDGRCYLKTVASQPRPCAGCSSGSLTSRCAAAPGVSFNGNDLDTAPGTAGECYSIRRRRRVALR